MRTKLMIAAVILLMGAAPAAARDVDIVALDATGALLRFDSARPGEVRIIAVTGVRGTLVGIDRRPTKRLLYGLSDANDLYTIDPTTGAATAISTLTSAFDGGARSGVDFNPQSDRLRLVGGSGQNLRVNVDLGAAATDAPLRYAATDPNGGKRPAIAAIAYTSSIPDAPTTKLFDIDSDLDVLALQDPPNDGVLVTIGPLGVDFDARAGFDIVTENGADRAFAASRGVLYEVDLATGTARALGPIGAPSGTTIIGLTILPETASATP
ncbi:MAG: DUF4394 domain-containing protein [Candidatus Binatia bacterium]